jgi:hypothetical protein
MGRALHGRWFVHLTDPSIVQSMNQSVQLPVGASARLGRMSSVGNTNRGIIRRAGCKAKADEEAAASGLASAFLGALLHLGLALVKGVVNEPPSFAGGNRPRRVKDKPDPEQHAQAAALTNHQSPTSRHDYRYRPTRDRSPPLPRRPLQPFCSHQELTNVVRWNGGLRAPPLGQAEGNPLIIMEPRKQINQSGLAGRGLVCRHASYVLEVKKTRPMVGPHEQSRIDQHRALGVFCRRWRHPALNRAAPLPPVDANTRDGRLVMHDGQRGEWASLGSPKRGEGGREGRGAYSLMTSGDKNHKISHELSS